MNEKTIRLLLLLTLFFFSGCETLPEELAWLAEPEGNPAQMEESVANSAKPDEKVTPIIAPEVSLNEVDQPAQKLETSSDQQFDDWSVQCNKNGYKGCLAVHHKKNDSGQTVIRLVISPATEIGKASSVTAVLPFGFYLPDQARLFLGISSSYQLTIQQCIASGCIAVADDPTRLISEMQKGEVDKGTLVMRSRDSSNMINIEFSRQGFAEAYQYILDQ
ncbi:MAG: invasion associated locus B family protein [Magnetococcales bacterium]|nr:invasion associated locus B family protein [Magnetococcales bacterium]